MAAAGVKLAFDLTQHSVTGLADVVKNYFKFKRLFDDLVALAIEQKPHVIICVDFSAFNSRFAAAIKRYVRQRRGTFNNWNPRIIKYISPQVWGSRPGRAHQIARDFDLLLSIFPFEKAWYARRVPQLPVEFIGHPLMDRHAGGKNKITDDPQPSGDAAPLILLLPGSRAGELKRHLPPMFDALKLIQKSIPSLRASLILPNEDLMALARQLLPGETSGLRLQAGGLSEALTNANVAIASTGTVTMECAYFGVPTVTLYKAVGLSLGKSLGIITVKWLTMPNILANEEVFPEFLQGAATPENLARAALELLRDSARRETVKKNLAAIIGSLGAPGASQRAAAAILRCQNLC
jgi:lipid-A-disaccharide synthase